MYYTLEDVRALLRHLAEKERHYAATSRDPITAQSHQDSADFANHYAKSPVLGPIIEIAMHPATDGYRQEIGKSQQDRSKFQRPISRPKKSDITKEIMRISAAQPNLTNNAIATMVGVSHQTVSKVRKQAPVFKVTSDGRTLTKPTGGAAHKAK